MPTARPSPIIVAEMADWQALGGFNLGILGDANHRTGFHRAGFQVPPTDYSRRHDPGLPWDMEWACAGDFGHGGKPALRARHAVVLGRLMRGELGMIDEFIGQPWPDEPVKYWARWLGVGTLKNYTGAGHTTWSHISWRRSRANERANLWTTEGTVATMADPQVEALYADAFKGGGAQTLGTRGAVPPQFRATMDGVGNAATSQRVYLVEVAKVLADDVAGLADDVAGLLARPPLTDAQAADFAERVAAILAPRLEAAAAVTDARLEAAVERVLERARLSVDASAGG